MSDFSNVQVKVDLSNKTADVTFGSQSPDLHSPRIVVFNAPWDTPEDQTESQIKEAAIKNALQLLREIAG